MIFLLAKFLLMAIQRQHGCRVVVILISNSWIMFSFDLILSSLISLYILTNWCITVEDHYQCIVCYTDFHRRLYTQAFDVHPYRRLEEALVFGWSSKQETEVHYLYLITWSSIVSRKKCETWPFASYTRVSPAQLCSEWLSCFKPSQ